MPFANKIMPRIYLLSIFIAVLLALIFGDTNFFFDPKPMIIFGRETDLNSQIIISALAVIIILFQLVFGILEGMYVLFKKNKKGSKKKEMAVKK